MTELDALTTIEHAIDYLATRGYPDDGILMAIGTLYEAHKAILFKICDNYRSLGDAQNT